MTASEAARLLRLNRWTVGRLVRDGRIPAFRFGDRAYRIRKGDVDKFISSSAVRPVGRD